MNLYKGSLKAKNPVLKGDKTVYVMAKSYGHACELINAYYGISNTVMALEFLASEFVDRSNDEVALVYPDLGTAG